MSVPEAEALLAQRRIGPLEGFRSKAGWPFTAELTLAEDAEAPGRYKLEFDFGDSAPAEETPQAAQELAAQPSLGPCPRCGSAVKLLGKNYVCEKSVATDWSRSAVLLIRARSLSFPQSGMEGAPV